MLSDDYMLTYESPTARSSITFTGGLTAETMLELRGREWAYSLAAKGLKNVSRKARELTLTVKVLPTIAADAATSMQNLMDMADGDMAASTPGWLYFGKSSKPNTYNDWFSRVFIPKTKWESVSGGLMEVELTIVLLDGLWRHSVGVQDFFAWSTSGNGHGDLPYDLPSDLASPKTVQLLKNPSGSPCEFVARLFGPVSNPQFKIGENRYAFDITIPDGGRLDVTSFMGEKSIVLTRENGDRTNEFACGSRGSGSGSGEYCFELIQPGEQVVTISGNWTLTLDWYEISGSPRW